jgi:hypothetical protein
MNVRDKFHGIVHTPKEPIQKVQCKSCKSLDEYGPLDHEGNRYDVCYACYYQVEAFRVLPKLYQEQFKWPVVEFFYINK